MGSPRSEVGILPESSLFIRELKAITDAVEGIESFNDRHGNPDGYCACDGESRCYLHGVLIPKAVRATDVLANELRRELRG